MAEESRMTPPPPPPPRSSKPVPPPPPGRSATPPPPPAPMGAPVPPAAKPMSGAPIPFPPGGSPVGPMPAIGGMPGMPGAAPNALDKRLQDMERRFQEQEESKKRLEEKARELEVQLKEEHEKVILQSLKAKEEESLSVKVEQQLRDMQEKLRREKYEQELQESRGKAENQLKDLERRISEERETWMTALKNQLKEREVVEREVEQNLTRRLRDFEQRYQEDKNQWTLALRQKEEELNQERRRFELELEKLEEDVEDKEDQISSLKETAAHDRHGIEMQHQAEYRALQAQHETQMRETGSWKAQVAMVQAQLQQLEAQHQQDRVRLESQIRQREEELKREYSMRELERTQYWEGITSQMKSEKESLRMAAVRHEEEAARVQVELADLKRKFEMERTEWQTGIEKARRLAREEALRDLPQVYDDRLKAMQLQLVKAGEAHKTLQSKFDVEHKRWEQQRLSLIETQHDLEKQKNQLVEEFQRLKAESEGQTQELLRHVAESQTREAATREEMDVCRKDAETQLDAFKRQADAQLEAYKREAETQIESIRQEKEKLDTAIAGSLQEAYAKEEQMKKATDQIDTLKSRCDELTRQIEENRAKEELWKTSQSQLTAAFHNLQGELVKIQNEHSKREGEWSEKEASWKKAQESWEKKKSELEKSVSEVTPMAVSADAQKALAAIRQQMTELRTIFASLRP